MNKFFIMVCGPAASGKSTVVEGISRKLNIDIYKPSRAYIDLAKQRGIPVERAFDEISAADAEDYFVGICLEKGIVVGDQHLALQYERDSRLAARLDISYMDVDEPYVSAINYSLFEKLEGASVDVLVLFLKASSKNLYERAYKRYEENGMPIRNRSILEVDAEVVAEEYYFEQLLTNTNVKSYVIDTDSIGSDEVVKDAICKVKVRREG